MKTLAHRRTVFVKMNRLELIKEKSYFVTLRNGEQGKMFNVRKTAQDN